MRATVFACLACGCLSLVATTAAQPDRAELQRKMEAAAEGETFTHEGVRVTMHRKNAGSAREDGWYEATSTGCGFRMLMPGPYGDISQAVPTEDGAELVAHTLASRTIEGAKFTATCYVRSDRDMPANWAKNGVEGFDGGGRLKTRDTKAVRQAGLDGYELRGTSKDGGPNLILRNLVGNGAGYSFIVEYPASEADYMPELAETFLDSFRPGTDGR